MEYNNSSRYNMQGKDIYLSHCASDKKEAKAGLTIQYVAAISDQLNGRKGKELERILWKVVFHQK